MIYKKNIFSILTISLLLFLYIPNSKAPNEDIFYSNKNKIIFSTRFMFFSAVYRLAYAHYIYMVMIGKNMLWMDKLYTEKPLKNWICSKRKYFLNKFIWNGRFNDDWNWKKKYIFLFLFVKTTGVHNTTVFFMYSE